MADALKDVTVLSRGGLFTNEDALALAGSNPGAAVRMLNMEISQFGGYRRPVESAFRVKEEVK